MGTTDVLLAKMRARSRLPHATSRHSTSAAATPNARASAVGAEGDQRAAIEADGRGAAPPPDCDICGAAVSTSKLLFPAQGVAVYQLMENVNGTALYLHPLTEGAVTQCPAGSRMEIVMAREEAVC